MPNNAINSDVQQRVGWGEERTPTFHCGRLRWGFFVIPTYGLDWVNNADEVQQWRIMNSP